MATDYSNTLNLPKTEFPMRANLPAKEPEILKKWNESNIYQKQLEQCAGGRKFILHDGPPYANGGIHLGTALNKVLKDMIVKYFSMKGYYAPYVPGWDTHGLPIEHRAIIELGLDRHNTDPVEFRDACKGFALKYLDIQREEFKRLGVRGDWDHPYITMDPKFEARQVKIFGEMARKGYIYKGMRPVYWCADCETALAEAEIEYEEDSTVSVYVKFPVKDGKGKIEVPDNGGKVYFLIWTTTIWTLPGNMAICLNDDFTYSLVKAGDEYFIIARELVEDVMKKGSIDNYTVVENYKGAELGGIICSHPFLGRDSVIITGEHVTLEAGTGCVHTAPGHGAEDFYACREYNIPVIVPVDDKGYLTREAGQFSGLFYEKANAEIEKELKESGMLFASEKILHQYPHCWRCKEPIIYRATEQWFASIDGFREEAINAIKEVEWIPQWGEDRITGMVRERRDWCISRQRTWGVPIPIFYCDECGEVLINEDTIEAVSKLFGEKGSNAWYTMSAEEILPPGTFCKCGCSKFRKENDIMDVWFDSGSTHDAVLETREELGWPADMYLEGSDQHRGWFQSSLLTAVATRGKAPYRTVLTHGYVVDGEGRKMSKSLGNGIDPQDVINQYGADILRLWVASSDYRVDIRISPDILKQLTEVYRKIRNTARFILGNISDFLPDEHMVPADEMQEIDRWALTRVTRLVEKVDSAYRRYEFHQMFHAIHNFCVVDMSNFYLDILKDRLYTMPAASRERRSAQSAMYRILDILVRMLAPVLAFTSEEIWQNMPHGKNDIAESIQLNKWPGPESFHEDPELEQKWERIIRIREDVSKALELARNDKTIGHSLNAEVAIYADKDNYEFIKGLNVDLASVFIVSAFRLEKIEEAEDDAHKGEYVPGIRVKINRAPGEKCERCWMYSETVGTIEGRHDVCERCANVLEEIGM